MVLSIVSQSFKKGEVIPIKHTCDGEDVSPALSWNEPPQGTKSYVLICDDPDAPMGTWIHWVIYNIPSGNTGLPEAVPKQEMLPGGTMQGLNSWRKSGYGGPCPPPGKPHRYFFKLYALDSTLIISAGASKKDVLKAMESHIIGQAELFGVYGRK